MPILNAAVALLLLLRDETRPVQVRCPVDGTRFRAVEVVLTNQWGGVDYDFCRHAYRTYPLERRVWTCPACYFTGEPADFEHVQPQEEFARALTPEQVAAIRGHLTPSAAIGRNQQQDAIPGWVKFDLWAQTLRLKGEPAHLVGKAYLCAAWVVRQRGAREIPYFDEYDDVWEHYLLNTPPLDLIHQGARNRTDFELGKAAEIERDVAANRWEGVQRTLALYIAGMLYREHGETVDALRVLRSIEEEARQNSPIDENLRPMIASIEQERGFQRQALEALTQGAAGLDPPERGDVLYEIGEVHRRLGETDDALAAFAQVVALEGALEPTKYLARRQTALLRGEPLPPEPRPPEPPPEPQPPQPDRP